VSEPEVVEAPWTVVKVGEVKVESRATGAGLPSERTRRTREAGMVPEEPSSTRTGRSEASSVPALMFLLRRRAVEVVTTEPAGTEIVTVAAEELTKPLALVTTAR